MATAQIADSVTREHILNEETVRAIEESYDPANLIGPYDTAEAMIKDMLATHADLFNR